MCIELVQTNGVESKVKPVPQGSCFSFPFHSGNFEILNNPRIEISVSDPDNLNWTVWGEDNAYYGGFRYSKNGINTSRREFTWYEKDDIVIYLRWKPSPVNVTQSNSNFHGK